MGATVLVLTSSFDEHADIVCSKIISLGTPVVRLDTDCLDRYEIGLMPTHPFLTIRDSVQHKGITAEDVISVWYRRPSPDRSFDEVLDADSLKFFRGETKEWIKSLTFALKDTFWVTPPWILYGARNKAHQLSVAASLGMRTPKTLITKNRALVERFMDECENGVVAKPLKAPYVESKDAYYTLRTQEIVKMDLDDPSLFICPTIFQEKVSTRHELRVVTIGKRLFAFSATPRERNALDIRTGGLGNIEYSSIEIQPLLKDRILKLTGYFNLPFSSMDLLVNQDGEEFFVDLNPNGQWLWLELTTGIVMSDLFVEMLVKGKIPE